MEKFKTTFRKDSSIRIEKISGEKHVVLVYGGMSSEREVSLLSYEGLVKALVKNGYKVTSVDMGVDIADTLGYIRPDVVFNGLYGTYGEDGCLPGILNILNIPYTHSGLLSSAICFDKIATKNICLANNIRCTKGIIVNKSDNIKTDPIPRPYVIKPIREGSSIGVHIIFEEDKFNFSDYVFEYGDKILVEEYVGGKEIQVAMLNGKALGILEIELLKGKRFYDYEAKYTNGFADHIYPARMSKSSYDEILKISECIYKALWCKGVARVEFRYSEKEDVAYFMEINTHPGFTPLSIVPEIASYNGISFEELVENMVNNARCD